MFNPKTVNKSGKEKRKKLMENTENKYQDDNLN